MTAVQLCRAGDAKDCVEYRRMDLSWRVPTLGRMNTESVMNTCMRDMNKFNGMLI